MEKSNMFDLLIKNGTIVTVNPDFNIIEDGLIGIKDGVIKTIKTKSNAHPVGLDAKKVIDAKEGIIMPGLINTHTHLPMTLFRGLADDLALMEWLNNYIFPAESRFIIPEFVDIGTKLSCAEMLLSGTTTCCDGYFYEDNVASALHQSGMRAVLGQGIIDFPAPGVPDIKKNIQNASCFIDKWNGKSERIIPSLFCHSPYTCSKRTLTRAKKISIEKGVLFQIHAAETKTEMEQCRSKHGLTPIQYLKEVQILDENSLLVHAIWVDDPDIELMAANNCKISHNPESNMKLASGISPVPELIKAGITVGLGTDGGASNNNLDLLREMDTAAKIHKVSALDPTIMDSKTIIKMATIDGAKAIGLGEEIGSLEIGKKADLIVIDTRAPHLVPCYQTSSNIVYSASGADVKHVVIGGEVVVENRKLLCLDIDDIIHNAIHVGHKIKEDLGN